jgi:hypothetical protein
MNPMRSFPSCAISRNTISASSLVRWLNEFARKTLDAAEANVTTFCDHASQLAQAESPVECVRLQTEFVKSSMASMQKQSTDIMRAGREAAE